jgi:uncharacterized protein (TIGR03435 family)
MATHTLALSHSTHPVGTVLDAALRPREGPPGQPARPFPRLQHSMRITAAFIVVWTLAAAAQQAVPSFEVTSVKPNDSGALEQSGVMGKGTLTMTNMRLRALITTAYATRPDRILGLPDWTDRERFDLAARAPANTPDNQLPLMLRSLLVDRFGLVIRPEMRDQPVYALVMVRGDGALGPNLKPSTACAASRDVSAAAGTRACGVLTGSDGQRAYITGGARSIDLLARALLSILDRPVVNRTGLAGTYDFHVTFAAASAALSTAAPPSLTDAPSIFSALQEQLGLRLEASTGPIEFFIVERLERPSPD